MRFLVAGVVGLLALALAPAALGAQRYAAPGLREGASCAQADPCSLKVAITEAKENDEVILTGGTYTAEGLIATKFQGIDVHGDPAGPMPKVTTATGGKFLIVGANGSLSYLEVIDTASTNPIAIVIGGLLDRVNVVSTGKGAVGVELGESAVVRDSLIRAAGDEAFGVFATGAEKTGRMVNDTVIASGDKSKGIGAIYQHAEPGFYSLDVKNVIARGEEADLLASGNSEGPGSMTVSDSNFVSFGTSGNATITRGSGNQTAAPLFVNAAAGDYREAAGSPTIDAGAIDPQVGPLDLAGNPRTLGATVDIGAFEFVPPAAIKAPAPGQIQSLKIAPAKFKATKGGGATVTYSLSAAATVAFTVERKVTGRRAGKKCVKRTAANKGERRCALYKPVKGSFSDPGVAGANSFKFSGRLAGKALPPGAYRLVGTAGTSTRSAGFKIAR